MGTIRGAIFDLDGTLLDSMYVWQTMGQRLLAKFGIEDESVDRILMRMSLEKGAEYLHETYELPLSYEGIIDTINDIAAVEYYENTLLKPGVAEFLAKLAEHGIPMCVATASVEDHTEAALRRNGVWQYFEGIATCSEAGIGKIQPDVFLLAWERFLGSMEPREDVFVFEDAYHAARSAKSVGFSVVGISDPWEENQQTLRNIADITVSDLRDALPFLLGK